jgi:hypothetical protein
MGVSVEVERQVNALLAKRAVVQEWPEGEGRDVILRAIEDLIVDLEMEDDIL